MVDPAILHADLDAFYASVEQRDRPELRGRPVVVGGGVVLAASYEARRVGVRSAMSESQAQRLCPGAITVSPRFEAYAEASRRVFACFADVTPLVEPLSVDEAFLDVSGARRLWGEPASIAAELRRRVRDQVGLPLSVGVARTKFLAKVASARSKPDGLLVVAPHGELEFLHPLPVEVLWGVGPVTAERLRAVGITRVGELATAPEPVLVSLLGRGPGRHLRALAWNCDPRPVESGRRDRSVGAQRALGRRPRPRDELDRILAGLVDRVAGRLRRAERLAATITVRVRDHQMASTARSRTLVEPSQATSTLGRVANELLADLLDGPINPECSLIGVSCSRLQRLDAVQLALPLDGVPDGLDEAIDRVRERFGSSAVTRAGQLTVGAPSQTLPRPGALDAG